MKGKIMRLRILVRGSNDIGSAAAHRLFQANYAVVIHDAFLPTVTRRKMAFTDAIFDGKAELEGVQAVRWDDLTTLSDALASPQFIPVFVGEFNHLLETIQPEVLIDARMRKHQQPETQRGLAPLTIGLGPNFVAGETTDLVVETSWGEAMGKVIEQGPTRPLKGEPREIGGHARERYVYAPDAGTFYTDHQIGDRVEQGQVIARINAAILHAPLTGILRGLTHTDVLVSAHAKVIEIDPRSDSAQVEGIAERPARIADGVLSAVQTWEKANAA